MPSPFKKSTALLTSSFLLFTSLFLFSLSGATSRLLLSARDRLGLTQAPATDNLPPEAAFTTVALGGFRGILADLLWMRAGRLQEEGRFFELAQLSDWIARLQPRSPAIWAYHAWNMAYNIPALLPDPADRWRWVQTGLSLLRDDGMTLNPGSARLHRELAWLYLHKLGTDDDSTAPYYRAQFAQEAPPRPDPALQASLDARFGPLDWSTPQAHAIYWATAGLPYAHTDFDDLALRRIVYQSLFQLLASGHTEYRLPTLAYLRETAARHPSASSHPPLIQALSSPQ
jgi:hypothetical protein